MKITPLTIVVALALAGCAARPPATMQESPLDGKDQRELGILSSLMTGAWKSVRDAFGPSDPAPRVLRASPIWTDRAGEFWMYAEIAAPEDEGRPLVQRIYRFTKVDGELVAITYRLPGDSLRFAGEWGAARPFQSLKPSELIERTGCRMTIQQSMAISTYLATIGTGCRPEGGDAAYETTQMQVTPDTVKVWDRGFDAKGGQVTGSAEGPLVMKKMPGGPR